MRACHSLPTESEQSGVHHLNHVWNVINISLQLASMRMPACMSIGMFATCFCFFLCRDSLHADPHIARHAFSSIASLTRSRLNIPSST